MISAGLEFDQNVNVRYYTREGGARGHLPLYSAQRVQTCCSVQAQVDQQ